MMKKLSITITTLLVFLFAISLLGGCGTTVTPAADNKVLKVGVTAGPHAEIMESVKKVAANNGLTIKIIEFNDYTQPNVTLNQGSIDANSFQNQPYLDKLIEDHKYEIVPIAKTVIFPMGIYSKKVKTPADVEAGSAIAIPNDPTNGSRALLLLEKAGLLTLKPLSDHSATVADITTNPKNLIIEELDGAQISQSLADVSLAVINANYAATAGLMPSKDALLLETGDSPYVNVIAVRTKDKDNPAVQKLVAAYHSTEVKQFIEDHFKGSMVTAW